MPRLGFRKSRRGCKRCKERRVKCDEQMPCGPCIKRNMECPYLSLSSNEGAEVSTDLSLPSNTEEWILDLECMHHYNTSLYWLGAREEVVHLWRDYIPQQASEHPFLMHGLLAYAALHLAHLKPNSSSKYLRLCDKHQAIALQKFRSILSAAVRPECADALFALSITLSLSYMARSCALSDNTTIDVDSIAELFVLTKGVKNVLRLSHAQVKKGPMGVMLNREPYPTGTTVVLPPNIIARFEALQHMLSTSGLDEEALEDCNSALTELKEVYKALVYLAPLTNIETGVVSRWQVIVSMGYVKLIQAQCPPALVVLAHYAAAFTAIRTAWYTRDWAEYALRGISQTLEDSMQRWIKWPMQQVQDRMKELGVQSPAREAQIELPTRTLPATKDDGNRILE